MEDEEHVIFGCPKYETCRLKYPKLFNGSPLGPGFRPIFIHSFNGSENNIKDLFNIDDQESISKFLWDIRNIRINSGSEC